MNRASVERMLWAFARLLLSFAPSITAVLCSLAQQPSFSEPHWIFPDLSALPCVGAPPSSTLELEMSPSDGLCFRTEASSALNLL